MSKTILPSNFLADYHNLAQRVDTLERSINSVNNAVLDYRFVKGASLVDTWPTMTPYDSYQDGAGNDLTFTYITAFPANLIVLANLMLRNTSAAWGRMSNEINLSPADVTGTSQERFSGTHHADMADAITTTGFAVYSLAPDIEYTISLNGASSTSGPWIYSTLYLHMRMFGFLVPR